jgi:hypothetical protein
MWSTRVAIGSATPTLFSFARYFVTSSMQFMVEGKLAAILLIVLNRYIASQRVASWPRIGREMVKKKFASWGLEHRYAKPVEHVIRFLLCFSFCSNGPIFTVALMPRSRASVRYMLCHTRLQK